jgi:hypothetical protein
MTQVEKLALVFVLATGGASVATRAASMERGASGPSVGYHLVRTEQMDATILVPAPDDLACGCYGARVY